MSGTNGIPPTNSLNIVSSTHLLLVYLYAPAFHVEKVAREYRAIEVEVEDPEAEYQKEEQQQFVGEDQEQELVQELTNFVDTQGKPRFI